jgi:hypothetical protein
MRDRDSDSSFWDFIQIDPKVIVSMRRSNVIITLILVFILLGLSVALLPSHAASKVVLKGDNNPSHASLSDFKNREHRPANEVRYR